MKRLFQISILAAAIVAQVAPVLAYTVYTRPNCDQGPRSEWARCVIEQSQRGGSE